MKDNSQKRILSPSGYQNIVVCILVIILAVAMTMLSDKFLTYSNLMNIMTQASLTIMAGCAVTMIIISGNFDLSIGGIMAMSGVLFAYACRAGIAVIPAVPLAIFPSLLLGFMNGILVTKLRVPSFISTMGVMFIGKGIAYIVAEGATIGTGLPYNFTHIGVGEFLSIPYPVIYTLLIFAIMVFVQIKTKFGKQVYAIGANATAADLSGINCSRITTTLYVISAGIAAFCGVMYTSRIAIGDCTIGQGFEFEVIIASVLGGTSVNGGRGSIIGLFFGSLLLRILGNGLNLLGMVSYYQDFVNGLVLLAAVILNKYVIILAESKSVKA